MRGLLALALVIVLIAAGCGGDSATTTTHVSTGTTTSQAPETTTAPTTTVAATTTTMELETTTTASSSTTSTTAVTPVCPFPPALAEGTLEFAGVSGDFDGDGNIDELLTYQAAAGDWRVRVVFADGGGADAAIDHTDDLVPPRPIGGFDIDGDGPQEAFVTVGAGASTTLVGMFDVASCVATRISTGGVAAEFSVGASAGAESGLVCPGDGTVRRNFAQRVDESTFTGGYEEFLLEGARLTSMQTVSGEMSPDDAALLAGFDCGGLTLP